MSAPVAPLRAKHWTADHLQLAVAAERARFSIRRLLPSAPPTMREELGAIADTLSNALKARSARRGIPTTGERTR